MRNLLSKNIEYLRKQRKWTQREMDALKAEWPQFNVNYIFDQKINDAIESESNLKDVMLLLREINYKVSATR